MTVTDDLKEQKFDALLKPALYEQMLQELQNQELPAEKHLFSKSFNKKMTGLMEEKETKVYRLKNFKTLAAVSLLAITILGFITMNVEAIRVPIQNLFMGDTHSTIDFGDKKGEIEIPVEYEEYAPGYVISGYELVYAYADEKRCYLQYSNIDGQEYFVVIYKKGVREAFDTEEGIVTEKKIGKYNVIIMEKEGEKWIDYRKNNMIYTINGSAEKLVETEVEKILDSM